MCEAHYSAGIDLWVSNSKSVLTGKLKACLPLIFLYFLYQRPNSWHLMVDTLA